MPTDDPLFRLYNRAIEVIGEGYARDWIEEPNPAIGNDTPRDHARTPEGLAEVLDLLEYINP